MANVTIDGVEYDLDPNKNLLQAALDAGLDIPYFCWHPALGSVGACRQCAVKQYKDENDTRGMMQMACMVPCTDGARFSIKDPDVSQFRSTIIEWLMTNHPHDCPVCDEGGECHLQDMTVMTGHNYRKYRFEKRTHRNQNLGPFVAHEMNRCITCYRCTRFYNDYAGGKDLGAFASHNYVFFGRHEDGTLENEFSGNLVEVCPTGVFTDKTFKSQFIRKWDLATSPSVCSGCSLGCNIIPGERYGKVRRVLNRYNGSINGYFICDRGRFGHGYIHHESRIDQPMLCDPDGELGTTEPSLALEQVRDWIGQGKTVVGIGSPRASAEGNFALRELVGSDQFSTGMAPGEQSLVRLLHQVMTEGPAEIPALRSIEKSDAQLVLGEDLTNTAPRMALTLRQAVRNKNFADAAKQRIPRWNDKAVRIIAQEDHGPLYLAVPDATKLDDIATGTLRGGADAQARVGFAIAHFIDETAPRPDHLTDGEEAMARQAAADLLAAEKPTVITGTSMGEAAVIQAAANVAWALCAQGRPAALAGIVPEANSMGVALMGGLDLAEAIDSASSADAVIVLENDLYRRLPAAEADKLFAGDRPVLVLDSNTTATTAKATAVFPVGTFAETDGTLINNEGRAQRYFQVLQPEDARDDNWRVLQQLAGAAALPATSNWTHLDDVIAACAEAVPALAGAVDAAPASEYRDDTHQKYGRLSRRASGRTAMQAHVEVSEPKPPEDVDAPMSFTMEGSTATPPAALANRFWAPGWNSVQSLSKFQDEIGGNYRGGDAGVRLLSHNGAPSDGYFQASGIAEPAGDGVTLLPLHHIFGSEERSVRSHGVAQRMPGPYLAVSTGDAVQAGLSEGDLVKVTVSGTELTLPLQLSESLAAGTAGFPAGLPDMPAYPGPVRVTITPAG